MDIMFIKSCIKEELVPKFAKVKSKAINNNNKLYRKVSRMILGEELTNKHIEMNQAVSEMTKLKLTLLRTLSPLTYYAIICNLNQHARNINRQIL